MQLPFAAARVAGKNIQNKLRAVNHAPVGGFFDVALLHRRQIPIENNQGRFVRRGFRANLVQFAAPDERGGICGLAHLVHCAGDFRAGAPCEFHQFGE